MSAAGGRLRSSLTSSADGVRWDVSRLWRPDLSEKERAMVQTINRVKAGTTEYVAVAQQEIPLDDPTAEGNGGLEGWDEDAQYRRFKSKAAAVRWLRSQVGTLPHMISGQIREVYWEADDFDDDRYGWIEDACEVERRLWHYWVEDDGTLRTDGEWTAQR